MWGSRAEAGAEGLNPSSGQTCDPNRDWFLVVSPLQHRVHVSPRAALGASLSSPKSAGGHVLMSGLRLLWAKFWPPSSC